MSSSGVRNKTINQNQITGEYGAALVKVGRRPLLVHDARQRTVLRREGRKAFAFAEGSSPSTAATVHET
jgi:hypothetical protein